jgi:membrane-associated phospholipid phosphatase
MWEIKLSALLYNPGTIFGTVFECIGETPMLIPVVFFAFIFGGIIVKNQRIIARKRELLLFSCYLFCVVILSATAVATIKFLWERTRFCDLTPPLYEGYTPFYAFGNGGNSFPSGHASMSAISFLLCDINDKFPTFSKRTPTLFAWLFTLLVCLSRLLEGAHFLTDLIAGVLITFLSKFALKRLFEKFAYLRKTTRKKIWITSS